MEISPLQFPVMELIVSLLPQLILLFLTLNWGREENLPHFRVDSNEQSCTTLMRVAGNRFPASTEFHFASANSWCVSQRMALQPLHPLHPLHSLHPPPRSVADTASLGTTWDSVVIHQVESISKYMYSVVVAGHSPVLDIKSSEEIQGNTHR